MIDLVTTIYRRDTLECNTLTWWCAVIALKSMFFFRFSHDNLRGLLNACVRVVAKQLRKTYLSCTVQRSCLHVYSKSPHAVKCAFFFWHYFCVLVHTHTHMCNECTRVSWRTATHPRASKLILKLANLGFPMRVVNRSISEIECVCLSGNHVDRSFNDK